MGSQEPRQMNGGHHRIKKRKYEKYPEVCRQKGSRRRKDLITESQVPICVTLEPMFFLLHPPPKTAILCRHSLKIRYRLIERLLQKCALSTGARAQTQGLSLPVCG